MNAIARRTTLMSCETRVSWDSEESSFAARLLMQPDGPNGPSLQLWNGWVAPAFTRAEAERIVDFNNTNAGNGLEIDTFEWDGDVLIQYWLGSREIDEQERIEPMLDDRGIQRWPIGAWAWTWYELPLTNDEAEAIGVDGRDGRGDITPSMLNADECRRLTAARMFGPEAWRAAPEKCQFLEACEARAWANGYCGPHQDAAAAAGMAGAIRGAYR